MEEFFDPTGSLEITMHELAPGLETLEGKRIGILDNSKTNADRYLQMVAEELQQHYGAGEWHMVTKPNLGQPAGEDDLKAVIADADLVITGIGD